MRGKLQRRSGRSRRSRWMPRERTCRSDAARARRRLRGVARSSDIQRTCRVAGTIAVMDRDALRAAQAPLKELYKSDPAAAWTPLTARGDYRDGPVTCTVSTFVGPVRAGLHTATGGSGEDACSGDMLLQALVACAGVTRQPLRCTRDARARSQCRRRCRTRHPDRDG